MPPSRRLAGEAMKLRYVSLTGADDAVAIADLNKIAEKYPFAEFAVLLMPEARGQSRVPTARWVSNFVREYKGAHKAAHLCGSAFLGFVAGEPGILDMMQGFRRIQLNLEFGDVDGKYEKENLLRQIRANPGFEFVIQYSDRNKNLLPRLREIPNHAILFDGSAGRGVSPQGWPAPLEGHFCGYAGGINPGNVLWNIEQIAHVAGDYETWIDMESGLRTDDRFDLDKVMRVLEISAPFAL